MVTTDTITTLENGSRYSATVNLVGLEVIAINSVVESKLRGAGFRDITVTGSGLKRQAVGLWDGPTQPIPAEYKTKFTDLRKL